MYALLCGDKDANTDEFNTCNKERVAQPDNVAYIAGHDGLIIGECSLSYSPCRGDVSYFVVYTTLPFRPPPALSESSTQYQIK